MRILFAVGSFLPVKGGGPYHFHHLSRHLERQGHTCTVVTTDAGDGDVPADTVPVSRSRSFDLSGAPIAPSYLLDLEREIRRFDPDLIHTGYPLPYYPDVAATLATLHDIACVITCHGAFEMSWDSVAGVAGQFYNRSLLKVTLRQIDRIHLSSEGLLEKLPFYQPYDHKTTIIPVGVDTEWFDPDAVSDEPLYATSDATPTLLYVGAFRRYKGLTYLLKAFAQVRREREAELVLVGDGPKRDELERLSADLELSEDVHFVGHITDDILRQSYEYADVFVLPSPSIGESFGMVGIEAMAMECPVVVTSGSGLGSLLQDEQAGVVVEPRNSTAIADAILELLGDEQEYQAQRRAGRTLVTERFAWNQLVHENIAMYESVLRDA